MAEGPKGCGVAELSPHPLALPAWPGLNPERKEIQHREQRHTLLPWEREGTAPSKSSVWMGHPQDGAGRGSVSLAQSRAVALFLLELHSLISASWLEKITSDHLGDVCPSQASQRNLPETFLTLLFSLCSCPWISCPYLLSQNLCGVWGGGRGRGRGCAQQSQLGLVLLSTWICTLASLCCSCPSFLPPWAVPAVLGHPRLWR